MNKIFLNGRILPEAEGMVSIQDRGFLYGDGVFETFRIYRGAPFRFADHWERLSKGAEFLKIRIPSTAEEVEAGLKNLAHENDSPEAVARVTLTRGVGKRGYSPVGADQPTLAISLHEPPSPSEEFPPQWKLVSSSIHVPAGDRLSRYKTLNKLPNILARMEADEQEADEALLLNTRGEVTEGSSSNLFWVEKGVVFTTPLEAGLLPGVTRKTVFEICEKLGIVRKERPIFPEELNQMEGVFLTVTTRGVVEVMMFEIHTLSRSPLVRKIAEGYQELVEQECRV